jgi:Mg2+ and Co2+ transporter CorA
MRDHLKTPQNDLLSLTEYETHLSDKVQFLLDAVLGFVNTKQNDIFQALTVISVVGIPPTLVASIYGMNFRNAGAQLGVGLPIRPRVDCNQRCCSNPVVQMAKVGVGIPIRRGTSC